MSRTNRQSGTTWCNPRRIFTFAATLALTAGLSQGAAAETTRYHGNICQPFYGSQAADFRYYSTGIKNQSSGYKYVSCPIDREVVWYSGPYSGVIHAYVYNAGGTVYCEGYNVNPSTGAVSDSHYTNTSSTGNRTLLMYLNPPTSHQYYVRCQLPPYSYLRAFYVHEPE